MYVHSLNVDFLSLSADVSNIVDIVPKGKGKGKKRTANDDDEVKMSTAATKDFGIEYAKSGRAVCRGCENKILKSEVRVKKVSFDSEVGMKYGGQAMWHHLDCFAKLRTELSWFGSGKDLPGYTQLTADDKSSVNAALP